METIPQISNDSISRVYIIYIYIYIDLTSRYQMKMFTGHFLFSILIPQEDFITLKRFVIILDGNAKIIYKYQ